jgi:hypothetical protein
MKMTRELKNICLVLLLLSTSNVLLAKKWVRKGDKLFNRIGTHGWAIERVGNSDTGKVYKWDWEKKEWVHKYGMLDEKISTMENDELVVKHVKFNQKDWKFLDVSKDAAIRDNGYAYRWVEKKNKWKRIPSKGQRDLKFSKISKWRPDPMKTGINPSCFALSDKDKIPYFYKYGKWEQKSGGRGDRDICFDGKLSGKGKVYEHRGLWIRLRAKGQKDWRFKAIGDGLWAIGKTSGHVYKFINSNIFKAKWVKRAGSGQGDWTFRDIGPFWAIGNGGGAVKYAAYCWQ